MSEKVNIMQWLGLPDNPYPLSAVLPDGTRVDALTRERLKHEVHDMYFQVAHLREQLHLARMQLIKARAEIEFLEAVRFIGDGEDDGEADV